MGRPFVAAILALLAISTRVLANGDQRKDDKRILCYYTASITRFQIELEHIDPFLCTHIIYSFMCLQNDGRMVSCAPTLDYDQGQLRKFNKLKEVNKELKTLLSVADPETTAFTRIASHRELRKNFTQSALEHMKYGFDGLDLNWNDLRNYQGRKDVKCKLVLFLKELREALEPGGHLLSAALSSDKKSVNNFYDIPQLAAHLDNINLVTEFYKSSKRNMTRPFAPLRAAEQEPGDDDQLDAAMNIDWDVAHWLRLGAPAHKLALTVVASGIWFQLADSRSHGLWAPVRKAEAITANFTEVDYIQMCRSLTRQTSEWQVVRDSGHQQPYAYDTLRRWVSYEDVESLGAKAHYVKQVRRLGGLAFYSLGKDDFQGECFGHKFPLLKAIKREFERHPRIASASKATSDVSSREQPPTTEPPQDEPPKQKATKQKVELNLESADECPKQSEDAAQVAEPDLEPTSRPNPSEKHIVCHYDSQAALKSGANSTQLPPDQLDPFLCTHLVYRSALLTGSGRLITLNEATDLDDEDGGLGGFRKFTQLKLINRHLKTLLSVKVAGYTFRRVADSAELQHSFVQDALDTLVYYDFDGLELDMEHVVERNVGEFKENLIVLLMELRTALRPRNLLLVARLPSNCDNRAIEATFDVASMVRYLDLVTLAPLPEETSLNVTKAFAPLLSLVIDDSSSEEDKPAMRSIDWSVRNWLKSGVPADKLLLTITTHGRLHRLAKADKHGLGAPTKPDAPLALAGFNTFCHIYLKPSNTSTGWRVMRDRRNRTPYAYKGLDWVSFEDPQSATVKAFYARDKRELRGVAVWTLDRDDYEGNCLGGKYPIIQAIKQVLRESDKSHLASPSDDQT